MDPGKWIYEGMGALWGVRGVQLRRVQWVHVGVEARAAVQARTWSPRKEAASRGAVVKVGSSKSDAGLEKEWNGAGGEAKERTGSA